MTARDTLAETFAFHMSDHDYEQGCALRCGYDGDDRANHFTDVVLEAIRGMSHDELRQLRPDIATLYDTTKDTANTRGDYILNLTDQRLAAVERERDELAAKIARIKALCRGRWGYMHRTVSVLDIHAVLRGNQ